MPEPSQQTISEFIRELEDVPFNDLPTDAHVLLEFITLVVDIKYRLKYGAPYMKES